jgi:hypothetical protein
VTVEKSLRKLSKDFDNFKKEKDYPRGVITKTNEEGAMGIKYII